MGLIVLLLTGSALYCAGAYAYLAFRTFRHHENWETETFHLGLCFILAIGFLGLIWS
jgi:hypothetical protein